jgi:hypothetical protein
MTEGQAADYMAGWRHDSTRRAGWQHDSMCQNCFMVIVDGHPIGRLHEVLADVGIDETTDLSKVTVTPLLANSMAIACRILDKAGKLA